MESAAMLKIPSHAMPWIIALIVILIILAFLAWVGFDHWSDLRDAT